MYNYLDVPDWHIRLHRQYPYTPAPYSAPYARVAAAFDLRACGKHHLCTEEECLPEKAEMVLY